LNRLETVSDQAKGLFVDLFVRRGNKLAIKLYESVGYYTYRIVNKYYEDEDALDMRKTLNVGFLANRGVDKEVKETKKKKG
jgi:ribosomal protein S18 acetylase RimI-like enzyme